MRCGLNRWILAATTLLAGAQNAFAYEGSLDVEQFDAVVPGAGVLNQSYGRIDAVDGRWIFGAGVQYSIAPLRLVRDVPEDPREEGDIVPALLRYEYLARHTLGQYFDAQVAVPYIQTIGTPDWTIGGRTKDDLMASSAGDVRASIGFDILKLARSESARRPQGLGVLLRTTAWIPVGGEKAVAAFHGERDRRYEPRITVDYITRAGLHFGLGVGRHIRKQSQVLHVVNGNAYRWGAFVERPVFEDSKLVASLFGAEQTAKQVDPQDPETSMPASVFSPREFMGGLVTDHGKWISTVAAGVGLNGAVGSPYRRYLFQIAWSPDEVKMRDSVADREKRREQKQEKPVAAACAPGQACERIITATILFESRSDHVRVSEARKVARALAEIKPDETIFAVRIEGRTDNRGSRSYNRDLSKRRASGVAQLLAATGISRELMSTDAFGFEKPVAANSDDAGRQQNRQVHVQFVVRRSAPEVSK